MEVRVVLPCRARVAVGLHVTRCELMRREPAGCTVIRAPRPPLGVTEVQLTYGPDPEA